VVADFALAVDFLCDDIHKDEVLVEGANLTNELGWWMPKQTKNGRDWYLPQKVSQVSNIS
jgi:hypothetical protein